MNTAQLQANHRLMVIGVAVILVTAALMYGALPQWRQSQTLQNEIETLQRRMAGVDIEGALKSEQQRIVALEQQLEPLLLVGKRSLVESNMLTRIQKSAHSSDLYLLNLSTQVSNFEPGLEKVSVTVQALTDFSGVLQWLQQWQDDESIQVAELRLHPESETSPKLKLEAVLQAFHQAENANANAN